MKTRFWSSCGVRVDHWTSINVVKKSFQVENKEAECSDKKGTIPGQSYSKGGVIFQNRPLFCENVNGLSYQGLTLDYISVTETIAHCAIVNKEALTCLNT